MKLLKDSYVISIVLFLIGLGLIGKSTPMVFTEESLNDKDKIVANLKKDSTRAVEAKRIKEIRRTQVDALIQIFTDYQQDMINNRHSTTANSLCTAIDLAGDIRAEESVDPLIKLICFVIERESSSIVTGGDSYMAYLDITSKTKNALSQIGKPAVVPLFNLLKTESANSQKSKFARETIHMIEGEFAIYHLEKALNDETDKKKKEILTEVIKRFRSEFKIK